MYIYIYSTACQRDFVTALRASVVGCSSWDANRWRMRGRCPREAGGWHSECLMPPKVQATGWLQKHLWAPKVARLFVVGVFHCAPTICLLAYTIAFFERALPNHVRRLM